MSVCRPGWVVGVSRWEVNVEVLAWDGLGGWDFVDVETSSAVVMEGRQHDAGGGAGFCSRREGSRSLFGVCRVTNAPSGKLR